MASRSDVITAAGNFRDALFKASQANVFSAAERDGFARLHDFYQDRLQAFTSNPRYGDGSAYHDNAVHWATLGAAAVPGCLPGEPATQQPVYDAANQGGDALDAVTSAAPSGGFLSFRSALLVSSPKVAAPVAGAVAQPVGGGGSGAAGPKAFGVPPQAPPAAGSAPAAPPGPVPPPKKTAADPSWFAKLMTMFPAEAVTAYLTGSQYFGGGSLWLVTVTLVAVLVVRWVALTSPEGKPNVVAVVVSGVSFLLWVGATADGPLATQLHDLVGATGTIDDFGAALKKGASFAILLWTWILPSVVKINPES